MKTYEWIIKIISYILCCAAVCAGFAAKEKEAQKALDNYLLSAEEQKTAQMRTLMTRLKNGLARCAGDGAETADFAEVSYCCKALSDAVSAVNKGEGSEALRLFFNRVKNVCDSVCSDKEKVSSSARQPVSELYMRLSAIEDMLLYEKTSASELIYYLSAGLTLPEETAVGPDRISVSRAKKCAYGIMGNGVRLRSCGIYGGRFIFASSGSLILLSNKGEPYIKSKTVTVGKERISQSVAADIAEKYIYDITGKPCKAVFEDKVFGIYYFTVVCDKKEYPVGIDKTDGNTAFYVISP